MMKRNKFFIYILAAAALLTGCSDMLETDSELVEYEKNNTLNHPTDSVYSVMGIVNTMQTIADRVVLLGEVRADLVTTTDAASSDLKRLANLDFSQANKYNQVSDYYAVINNCNYFLTHVDTLMERRGRRLFMKEYAAVKAFRAWTYLELAKIYGEVPFVTKPLMTEREAAAAAAGPRKGIKEICELLIDDLTPVAYTEMLNYGEIDERRSSEFFIPVRALLGDLCLWAGRYSEAAHWYSDYLGDKKEIIRTEPDNRVVWSSPTEFTRPSDSYSVTSIERISMIPMEKRIFDGIISDLGNIYSSTKENKYYFQLRPSTGMRRLSADQIYCMEYKNAISTDTIYAPRTGFSDDLYIGDLRLHSNFSLSSYGSNNDYSEYNTEHQYIYKFYTTVQQIVTYRSPMVYLRFAEALNRAGYPQSAMLILKYGLCNENAKMYVDSIEYDAAKQYIAFDETLFRREDVRGIHSRGSGDAQCNIYYALPQPTEELRDRQDTIDYQMPLVEDMIINEMALEGAFEGYRYYDLMRVAMRRGEPAYLADPISRRAGTVDDALRTKLMDPKNWYLPLP
ncbi:MAG: RagB/SusD family nutrient uptake outer membrane protein [Prevotella sp.]|nr:RagB/SusD family nutrient uptake outer membrane protein [Prevotella sp.]